MDLVKILGILFIPLILFVTVVLPTWLRLHYKEKSRHSRELSEEEWQHVEEILQNAEKMEERIRTLEKILDDSNVHWRERA